MPDSFTYDYAIVRVVPRVEREEFVNAGVIVSCPARQFLEARIELDERRLLALDPTVDIEAVRAHLATIPAICQGAGPIGRLSQRERFHWLIAARSTIIQTSSAHTGNCTDPEVLLEHLLDRMVRTSDPGTMSAPSGPRPGEAPVEPEKQEGAHDRSDPARGIGGTASDNEPEQQSADHGSGDSK